jgi:alpha-D-ribose 1-methylphosphonate 5-triphosphate synthase subunit PhnH
MDLTAGFADPIADSQATFRALLDAMAHPGLAYPCAVLDAPSPLHPATAAAVLTLADHETPLWIDPEATACLHWLTFHTGAPQTPSPAEAQFVLALSLPDLATLSNGTDEEPEASATVILQVRSLSSGKRYCLSGPGLRAPEELSVEGLPADFAAIWARNRGQFPRGVDLILCCGGQIAALPRSVSIQEA